MKYDDVLSNDISNKNLSKKRKLWYNITMILYHGSNCTVENPQIIESLRTLDFGTGFYLTSDLNQAKFWAKQVAKRRNTGSPIISVFEYNEKATLKILQFETVSKKWLKFIFSNRMNIAKNNSYDIIIGPVANDNTMPTLKLYFAKILDEKETMKRLQPQNLVDQFTFKTEKALSALSFLETLHG